MASLSEISIRRPVFAWMIMAALILFGAIGFQRMGLSQLPDVDFPVVSVGLSLPGAAPEVIESQVLDPIEDALMGIDGVRSINSTAQQSSGSISIEFELNRNIDEAVQEVENHINQVLNLLPTGMLPPTVRKTNPEDQPIIWIAVSSDGEMSLMDLMIYSRNTLLNQFSSVPGVGDILLGGYVDPALRVEVDLAKLKSYDLTAADVVNAINKEQIEMPAGRLEGPLKEYNVRVRGEARTADEFGKIRIENRTGGTNFKPTPLAKVANVFEGTADIRRISRFNGKIAVGLGVLKQHGSNAVEVAKAVRERLKEIQPTIPKGLHADLRQDTTLFIRQSVNELNFMLILSAVLTSIVCYLFLGSWTSTLNVLMAIPTSIVGSFIVLYFFGFTLNTFTLLGLSLAIGIVVDDAIMMLENIVRHRELGQSRLQAALKGADEIKFAAIAATVAVCAIFLPVVFMTGVIGRYFYQFGITVTTAVLLSLLEALTLTPMRCSQYLNVHQPKGLPLLVDRGMHYLTAVYAAILRRILKAPLLVLVATIALFVGSIFIARILPGEMIPPQDQSMFMLRLKGPVGSSIQSTNEKLLIAEKWISRQPEVEGYFSAVGGFGGDAVNQAQMVISLVDQNKRKISQKDLMLRFRKALRPMMKPMEVVGQDLSMRGFSSSRGFPVEFTLQGPDWEKLVDYTKKMMAAMTETGAMVDVNTDVQDDQPEYDLIPNRQKLATRHVNLSTVTAAMNTLVGGLYLNGQVEYPKAGHRYEIEVRLIGTQRDRFQQLGGITVGNTNGEIVPLSELVDIVEKPSLRLISRLNRQRAITVYANLAPGKSQQEALATVQKLSKSILPQGYGLILTGSAQSFKESMQSLIVALLLGILVSYMVLAAQFNSFIHPVAVLMALPFSISGAFAALWAAHQSINVYSMIGLILLMGIVKKNSILLVDFTNQTRGEGRDVTEALVHACPVRLRPIIMTSMATIAGALPEAISIGPGAETTVPMAVAIIGGVIASTFLTLFAVPCVYKLLSRFEDREDISAELSTLAQP